MSEAMALFRAQVYTLIAAVPEGRVASYGQIARLAGYPGYARHVGKALARLPQGSRIPWHRIVNSQGQITLAGSDLVRQKSALIAEGVKVSAEGRVNMRQFAWDGAL